MAAIASLSFPHSLSSIRTLRDINHQMWELLRFMKFTRKMKRWEISPWWYQLNMFPLRCSKRGSCSAINKNSSFLCMTTSE
jgi:hypothetical protein